MSYSSGKVSKWRELAKHIITIDETWVRAYEPELKRQSAEWRHEGSLRSQKFCQNPSPVKLMVILVFDVQGVILCHMVKLLMHSTMLHICKITFVAQLSVNCHNCESYLLHDNATPHKAICVRDLLQCWRWEVLDYPPYSADLLPCD